MRHETGRSGQGSAEQGNGSPRVNFGELLEKRIALQQMRVAQVSRAGRRALRAGISEDLGARVIDPLVTSTGDHARETEGVQWLQALDLLTGSDGSLTGVTGMDVVRKKDDVERIHQERNANTPEISVSAELPQEIALTDGAATPQLSEDLLQPGDPVEEMEMRVGESYALEETALTEGNKILNGLEGNPDEENVGRLVDHAINWGRTGEQQRFVEAMLEHPGVTLAMAIEIWDAANAKRGEE